MNQLCVNSNLNQLSQTFQQQIIYHIKAQYLSYLVIYAILRVRIYLKLSTLTFPKLPLPNTLMKLKSFRDILRFFLDPFLVLRALNRRMKLLPDSSESKFPRPSVSRTSSEESGQK